MIKKCMWVQQKALSNKDIIIIKSSFEHEIYRHKSSLSNYVWEVKNKSDIDPMLKWVFLSLKILLRCWHVD